MPALRFPIRCPTRRPEEQGLNETLSALHHLWFVFPNGCLTLNLNHIAASREILR